MKTREFVQDSSYEIFANVIAWEIRNDFFCELPKKYLPTKSIVQLASPVESYCTTFSFVTKITDSYISQGSVLLLGLARKIMEVQIEE